MSSQRSSPHLISSQLISCLLCYSQLISSLLGWCQLLSSPFFVISAFLISSLLIRTLPFLAFLSISILRNSFSSEQHVIALLRLASAPFVSFQVCFWCRCSFFSILFSSSFSSPHLSVSVSCFPYMFTFADIPSNLFPFPARHRSRFFLRGQTQVQLEVGSLRGPQRRTQLVFVGHDGIIQAFARDFLEKMNVKM